MTLSQYFTKMSDIGWTKDSQEYGERVVPHEHEQHLIAIYSVELADALIAELKKGGNDDDHHQ